MKVVSCLRPCLLQLERFPFIFAVEVLILPFGDDFPRQRSIQGSLDFAQFLESRSMFLLELTKVLLEDRVVLLQLASQ